jgi:hypothetical protein
VFIVVQGVAPFLIQTTLPVEPESSYYCAAMTEEMTAKKDTRDKVIGVVFTLALFVLLVWLILYLTVPPTTETQ